MNGLMPKAILLDMDDTIISFDQGVDTDECWRKSIRKHMLGKIAVSSEELLLSIKERAKWHWSDPERHRVGRLDLTKARQEIIAPVLLKMDINDLFLASSIAITYGEERDKAVDIFPDSVETIKQLRTKGIKLALLTNGNAEMQWKNIRRFDLLPHFDCVLVEGDLGIGKPEDRIYLHALEQLGVAADETWMVGDNFEWEVAAPQRLGIKGIWIDHKGAGIPVNPSTQPFMIIKSLSDLLSLI
jgi:putative hydrolase of the HAD superfamily